jgi:hypothetical protein
LKDCLGKPVIAIKAYGIDEYDFTRNIIGCDFSIGEFGYTVFEFQGSCFYISTDGVSSVIPHRPKSKELPVHESILETFIGRVLQSVHFEDDVYYFQFEGLDLLSGYFSLERGYTDRNYFHLDFPCE